MVGGRKTPQRDDADLVRAAVGGEEDAFGVLFDRWFDRTFDVAWRIVRNRDTAADVAQEAFLAAWRNLSTLRQPESFGGWLLRISRNRALNRLERDARTRPTDQDDVIMAADRESAAPDASDPVASVENDDLIWAAAAALGARDLSILDLHLRHGMTAPEIAAELDVTPNNAHQLLFRLKSKLGAAIKGWVLWKGGRPACAQLAGALGDSGVGSFGPEAVRVIDRHVLLGCAECRERQELRLAPDALFAAVPIAAAGPFLRQRAAAALEAEGVPISSSEFAPRPSVGRRLARAVLAAAVVAAVLVGAFAVFAGETGEGGHQEIAVVGDEEDDDEDPKFEPSRPTTRPTFPVIVKPESPFATTTTSTTATTRPDPSTSTTATTSSTSSTTTTTRPPSTAAPVITVFAATYTGNQCADGSFQIDLTWSINNADAASISPLVGGVNPVQGNQLVCAPRGQQFTLTASGPGGTDTASDGP